MEYTRKIGLIGQPKSPSYYITIPRELLLDLGWHEGRRVTIRKVRDRKQLIIEAFQPFDDYLASQAALDKESGN